MQTERKAEPQSDSSSMLEQGWDALVTGAGALWEQASRFWQSNELGDGADLVDAPAVQSAAAAQSAELRAAAAPAASSTASYAVKPGDTLSKIARATLGDANRWKEIAAVNGITDPGALQIGQVLTLPEGASGATAATPAAAPQQADAAPPAADNRDTSDPLTVKRGQVTFDSEGNDDAQSRYYSRTLHHPSRTSGVTIGRGYDMKHRDAAQITRHMLAAGVDEATAAKLAGGAKMIGDEADAFCQKHASIELTHDQQKALFEFVYGEKEAYATRLLKKWSAVDFASLDPIMQELIVDLFYRGDLTKTKWNAHNMATIVTGGDRAGFRRLLADRSLWGNVDTNRYTSRLAYLDRAAARNEQGTVDEDPADAPADDAAQATASGTVTASKLNVRSAPRSSGNTPVGSLTKGSVIEIVAREGEWLKITFGGGTAYVHGGFVSVGSGTATPAAPTVEQPQAPITADLATLMAKERLTAPEIARARTLIGAEPAARQPDLFEQLQGKVPYHSQRDNQSTGNGATINNMCNLTTLAMCLEYLGLGNPGSLDGRAYPQYEDYLEALRVKEGLPSRTTGAAMESLAKKMGAAGFKWLIGSTKNTSKSDWEGWRDNVLRKGSSILLSIGGHIVRVQGVTAAGLVVDDPYGTITLKASTDTNKNHWSYGDNRNAANTADTKGEDNVWSWADVEAHAMKWAVGIGL